MGGGGGGLILASVSLLMNLKVDPSVQKYTPAWIMVIPCSSAAFWTNFLSATVQISGKIKLILLYTDLVSKMLCLLPDMCKIVSGLSFS